MCRCLNEAGIDIVSTFTMKDNTTCGGLLESVKSRQRMGKSCCIIWRAENCRILKIPVWNSISVRGSCREKYSAYLIEKPIDMANGGNADKCKMRPDQEMNVDIKRGLLL